MRATQWLLNFFLINMCTCQLNKNVAGPYDIVIHYLENCLKDSGPSAINFTTKLKKINRSTIAVNASVQLGTPINDELSASVRLSQFTNGGWKENFYKNDFQHACSLMKTYIPQFLKEALKAAGYKSSTCPVQKGNYSVTNFVLKLDVPAIPVFFYNKYRFKGFLTHKGSTVACVGAEADVIPKVRKSRG